MTTTEKEGVADLQPLNSVPLVPRHESFQGIPVRLITLDKKEMMPAVDIARALKINRGSVTRSLKDDLLAKEIRDCRIATPKGAQKMVCITPFGAVGLLYKLNAKNIDDEKIKERISSFQEWATGLVQSQMQIQAKLPVHEASSITGKVSDVIARHFDVARALHRETGMPLDLAWCKALYTSGKELGMNLTPYFHAIPSVKQIPAPVPAALPNAVPDEDAMPTPADPYKSAGEIANLLNRRDGTSLRARHINNYLRSHGYLYKNEEGRKCMTDLGARYGRLFPFLADNGHTGYYLRWHESILRDSGLIRD